jgi:autotransporter translocation and assembly factor TamB
LFSGLTGGDAAIPIVEGQVAAASNLRFDVRLLAPSTLRIDNDQARVVASADLTLRGTPDRPLLFGHAEIERGEVEFEGRRYLVTRGSLDFADANRIQPFFDIESDLPGDHAHGRHDRATATAIHVGSAAADAGHPDAAFQRPGAERRYRAGRIATPE